jgi:hypothetical protein
MLSERAIVYPTIYKYILYIRICFRRILKDVFYYNIIFI